MNQAAVAVTSRSFSNNTVLRQALLDIYPQARFNDSGKTLEGAALIEFLQHQERIIVGLERFTADVIAQLPKLKVISRFGVGIDTLDIDALQARNIQWRNTAGANKRAVAECVIAFAINLLRALPSANHAVKQGQWQQIKGRQLSGKTVGILGFGAIGQDLAALLSAFDCNVLPYDIANPSTLTLEEVLRSADVVSVHLPLNNSTRNFLNAERLACLKPSAILINTSRGGIIDEEVVKTMLIEKRLAAAAFDVFNSEPPEDTTLLRLPNFFATPHLAGSTEEAILAIGFAAIEGLR